MQKVFVASVVKGRGNTYSKWTNKQNKVQESPQQRLKLNFYTD